MARVSDSQRRVRAGNGLIRAFGRLLPDVTFASASADLERIAPSLYQQFPQRYKLESGFRLWLEPLQDSGAGDTGRVL